MAASTDNNVVFAGRGSKGVFMVKGHPTYEEYDKFHRDPSNRSSSLIFSPDGKLFAYCNGESLKILSLPDCASVSDIPCTKTSFLHFSPKGTYIARWEMFALKKDVPESANNLHIYEVSTGKCLKSLQQKRHAGWNPQWSDDEKLVARSVNSDVYFHQDNKFDVVAKKYDVQKVTDFAMSPGKAPHHVIMYTPGVKGLPSMVKLFKYPKLEGLSAVVASRTFFKGDKVEMKWNGKGTAVLAIVSTDADQSGASYYGEQTLLLLTTSGEGSFVQLGKNGPIYSAEWSPLSTEFCVVYGFMPAKATLYNVKGDVTFDFGTSPRNLVYYNSFGNILILAGFGNLNGHLELWDLKDKKEICRTQSRDTTYLEWCPDGEHFLTATLTPRLRIGNGYRIWHYTGSLIKEHRCDEFEELWEIRWRSFLPGAFKEMKIVHAAVEGIKPFKEASKEVYRPPAARGLPPSSFKLHEDFEKPSNLKNQEEVVNKKGKSKKNKAQNVVDDPEKAERSKLMRNIKQKLAQIRKLEQIQKEGQTLNTEQVQKIKKKDDLEAELKKLKI